MERKASNVEDDFESLFEEEASSVAKDNKHLSFNDLFEAIAEESEDPIKIDVSDHQVDSVEEDFEALLSDESETEVKNLVEPTKEIPTDMVKGFSQIFANGNNHNSQESQPVNSNTELDYGEHDDQNNERKEEKIEGMNGEVKETTGNEELEEKLKQLTQQMITERNSFESKITQYDAEVNNLRDEVKNLKNNLSRMETQKNAAEQKIKELEKQKNATELLSSENNGQEKEEELLSQIKASKDKIEVQETTIEQLKQEVFQLRNADKHKSDEDITQSKTDDPTQKIILLEHELEDQKEVSEKLKAYVGEVLENVMISNPAVLERKQSHDKL